MIKKRSDLVDYSYVMALDIRYFDQKTRFSLKRTRVVNVYDQFIGRGYIFLGVYVRRKRTIKDIS